MLTGPQYRLRADGGPFPAAERNPALDPACDRIADYVCAVKLEAGVLRLSAHRVDVLSCDCRSGDLSVDRDEW